MGITINSKNEPDILGFEMKKKLIKFHSFIITVSVTVYCNTKKNL
jgi:hypothetical protein